MTSEQHNGDVAAVDAELECVTVPRELMQAILDYLATCPAGQVYPLLRRIDAELAVPVTDAERED